MKNFLFIFLIILGLVGLGFVAYKYREDLMNLGQLFKSADTKKLEEDNKKLRKEINLIKTERDLLAPQLEKQRLISDSLRKVDSIIHKEILREKEYSRLLAKRLSSSKDSVKKYRTVWSENVKKYNKLKNSQKKPNNEQTLEFFKKYK